MTRIEQVSTVTHYGSARRLFGAYQRAVESFASEADLRLIR